MLVGRETELSAAVESLRAGVGGRGSVLVVSGEPGIGKSALLAAAAAASDEWRTLRALGVERERSVPYSTLHALLWPLRDAVDELEPRQRALLLAMLHLGPPVEANVFAAGAAALALLSSASESRPHALVVDDAHWADEASQEALSFVGRRLEHERIALLAAARAGEPCLLAEERAFGQLRLDALPAELSRLLLERSAAAEIAPDVVERLLEVCAGNPLGLVELPRWLCTKERFFAYSGEGAASGQVGCVDFGGNTKRTFTITMLAPHSFAELAAAFPHY